VAEALAIETGNRGSSGKRRVELMGCSMGTLTRKGRNGRASQVLHNANIDGKTSRVPAPGSQTASSNTK
jgi:hypothetical protein